MANRVLPTLLLAVALSTPAQAQEIAANATAPLAVPESSVAVAAIEVRIVAAQPIVPRSDRTPIRSSAFDLSELLGNRGDWIHEFGAFGWPDGWSPRGIDPGRQAAALGGIPFNDPITGRPLLELFPLNYSGLVQIKEGAGGAPFLVQGDFAPVQEVRPKTELRYHSSSTGLQAVGATHSQVRNRSILGQQAKLSIIGGYSGAGSKGEYPGSQLKRKRQLMARIRLQFQAIDLEIAELHSRYRIGAQGGVEPFPGFTYESIYQRLGAEVEEESALRLVIRNDLYLNARLPFAGDTLSVRAFRTRHRMAYTFAGDTTGARAHVTGVLASLPLPITGRALSTRIAAWRTAFPDPGNLGDPAGETTLSIGLDGAVSHPLGSLSASAGLRSDRGRWSFEGFASNRFIAGFFASASIARVDASPIDRYGLGQSYVGIGPAADGQIATASAGWKGRFRSMSARAEVFAMRQTDSMERFLDSTADTVRIGMVAEQSRSGLRLALGMRETATRGVYLIATYRWMQDQTQTDDALLTSGGWTASDVTARISGSRPDHYVTARIGARMLLFKGDLDLDLYLRTRAWSEHLGRRLHTATGTLALPDAASRTIPGSVIFDVVAEGDIRTATLFLAFENAMSGTKLTLGNQLVPDYPYPAQRLRFGIYWPMFD